MLNSIGLANPGREPFPRRDAAAARELGVPIWVSVGGFAADEYAETCAALDDVTIELNLSCPNVDEAPESAAEIVAACRAATALPLYAKLSPATWDVGELARAVEAAGADGLSLVNTIRGLALDARTLRPVLGTRHRRLSGPALKPIALAAVHACYAGDRRCRSSAWAGWQSGRDALELDRRRSERRSRSERCSSPTRSRRPGSARSCRRSWHARASRRVEQACGIAHAERCRKKTPRRRVESL